MLELTNGTGAQALDIKQNEWDDEGYGVTGDVSSPGSGPLAVTINTGTLGTGNNTLSVASGDALVGGSTVTLGSSTSVDIETGDSEPRKDLVWIDSGGNLQVEKGTAAVKQPSNASRFETFIPAVPFPSTTPAAVLAAVYVPANATSISSPDIQDRRISSETIRSLVNTDGLLLNESFRIPSTTETISSGSISYTAPFIQVEGENGSADDLDALTGYSGGEIVVLTPRGGTITVRHDQAGADGFWLQSQSNFTMGGNDKIILIRTPFTGRWDEISRSSN